MLRGWPHSSEGGFDNTGKAQVNLVKENLNFKGLRCWW